MRLKIKVVPNSRKDEVVEGDPLIVRVRVRAERNKANNAVIKLLSKYFKSNVRIISGLKSKVKVVEVDGK